MSAGPRIESITAEQLEALLPLIAAYQRFYDVEEIDEECNRAFFSSLVPAETVLMNDLYVVENERGAGLGRALIEASAEVGRKRGAHQLQWVTAPDNETARRLYDRTGAESEPSIEYELRLSPPP